MEGPAPLEDERVPKRARSAAELEAAAPRPAFRIVPAPYVDPQPPFLSASYAYASAALQRAVPISPEGVRAFAEPAALSRAEELLAPTSEAAAEAAGSAIALSFKRDVDGRSLRLSSRFPDGANVGALIQRRDGDAASGGSLVCTAATCTENACRECLGLCPHVAAFLLHLAARPELLNIDEQALECTLPPALGWFNQLGEGSAGGAISTELMAFEKSRQPMWQCTVQDCRSRRPRRKEESCIPRGSVMKTLKPHANVALDGAGVNLQPVLGAPPFDRPVFYSRRCGHQLREEDKGLDGGDPSCFLRLLNRVNAFVQQLRAAGHLQAAVDAVLRLARSLWAYAGDRTFLRVYQSNDSAQHQRKIEEAKSCLVETFTSLCLMAIDDRLSQEARTALRDRAWSTACALFPPTEALPKLRSSEMAFFSVRSLFDHEGPITLWYRDFESDAHMLLQAARVFVRVTQMAGDPVYEPPSLSALAVECQSTCWKPPLPFLNFRACCRYLLERGRFQECRNLSRSLGDAETLAAAVQRLSGRPEDVVSAVLDLVDCMFPAYFLDEASAPLAGCGESTYSRLEGQLHYIAAHVRDEDGTFDTRCKPTHSSLTVCGECTMQVHRFLALREAYFALVRGLESLREQRAAANDHLSCVWLGVALIPFIDIRTTLRSRDRLPATNRDRSIKFIVRGGLALLPSGSPRPPSFARESTEALRIAKLPLAQAYAACAERPGEALEAALIRLATMGLLPYTLHTLPYTQGELRPLLEGKAASSLLEARSGCTAPQKGLEATSASALAARFYLQSTNRALHSVYESYSERFKSLDRDLPSTAELGSLYKVGNELFGPVDLNVDDPSRIREVAISLLAARTGSGNVLSVLGECEPLPAHQYETLLVVCVLRLTALACLDDVLWLIIALLELALDDNSDTAARRRFCAAVLFHRDFLRTRDQFTRAEYDESLHAPLVATASTSAVQLHLFADGAAAWKLAVRHARALDLYNAAFQVLMLCGGLVGEPALKSIFAGHPYPQNEFGAAQAEMGEVLAAAEAVAAASRSRDGFRAELFLSLLAATGDALSQPPSGRDQDYVWAFDNHVPERRARGYVDRRDRLFHSAVCLEASGRLEPATSLAVAYLFRYSFRHGAYAESLNMLDRIAPRLADLIGLPTQGVAASAHGPRRRLIEHCLARYEEPADQADFDESAFDARHQPYLSLLLDFVEFGRNEISPFVDYHLAAQIASAFLRPKAVRAFICKGMVFASLQLWRLVLNELGEQLRRGGLTEDERAGALQLAELVWDVCPCVQAVYVIRGVHSAAGEGSGGRWEGWLKEQLREIQQNTALVLTKTLRLPKDKRDRGEPASDDPERERAVRLILAAVALYLADENDEFGIEKALGLDFGARPSSVVSMMTLLARWSQVAQHADMSKDCWTRVDEAGEWHGTATLERAAARLDRLAGRAGLLLQQLFADAGRSPAGRDAVAVEDGDCTVERLEATCNGMLDHQDEYIRQVENETFGYRGPAGCNHPEDCPLCKGAWDQEDTKLSWRLHSLRLLAPPLLRLFVETFLRMPGMTQERGQALFPALRDAAAAYIVGCLTALSRSRESSSLSFEVASATAHKMYLATTTLCEELVMMLDLPFIDDFNVARHPALAHLRGLRLPICEAFLTPDADPEPNAESAAQQVDLEEETDAGAGQSAAGP